MSILPSPYAPPSVPPGLTLTLSLSAGSTYSLQVTLRVSTGSAPVQLTLKTSLNGQGDSYFPVAAGTASTGCWTQLNGTFTLTSTADMVVMYVEGPPPGTNVDIMVAAVVLTVPAATIRPTPSNVVSGLGFKVWVRLTMVQREPSS